MRNISSCDGRQIYDFFDGNGAVPAHRHPNGGGWVAESATVDESAYIARHACVFGNAVITDNAKIFDQAEISGYARVRGCAVIAGRAKIQGHTIVDDRARIDGDSFVSTNIHIGGDIRLSDHITLIDFKSCLNCPFIPADSYGLRCENPCVNCLAGIMERQKRRHNGKVASVIYKERCRVVPSHDSIITAYGIASGKNKEPPFGI